MSSNLIRDTNQLASLREANVMTTPVDIRREAWIIATNHPEVDVHSRLQAWIDRPVVTDWEAQQRTRFIAIYTLAAKLAA